jgi:hypothetical protein
LSSVEQAASAKTHGRMRRGMRGSNAVSVDLLPGRRVESKTPAAGPRNYALMGRPPT